MKYWLNSETDLIIETIGLVKNYTTKFDVAKQLVNKKFVKNNFFYGKLNFLNQYLIFIKVDRKGF